MEPVLRPAHVLKQEAEEIGYHGKEVAEYVRQHQALDREETAAWRDAQKLYAEEKRRADEIRIQMAEIEADKELTLKEMELKAQAQPSSRLQLIHLLAIGMLSP